MRNTHLIVSIALICATSAACNDTKGVDLQGDTDTANQALLRRATSCEDLTAALKGDARNRLTKINEQNLNSLSEDSTPIAINGAGGTRSSSGTSWASAGAVTGGVATPTVSAGGAASSQGTKGMDSAAGTGAAIPADFTGTNTQVVGVDEADIVKTDGVNVYVLRTPVAASDGTQGAPEVVVAKGFPAQEMALTTRTKIEGAPLEMFVTGEPSSAVHKVVVYSSVEGTALYKEAGLELPIQSDVDSKIYADCMDCGRSSTLPMTKVTVFDFENGQLTLDRETYYEGNYLSARRSDQILRTTLSFASRAPALRTYATEADQQKAFMMALQEVLDSGRQVADVPSKELSKLVAEKVGQVLISENESAIESMKAEQWLPRVFTRSTSGLVAKPLDCKDFYIPKSGSGDAGVTFVALQDLDAPTDAARGAAIVGVANTMYQNAERVVLASAEWDYSPETAGDSQSKTVLHSFDVSDPSAIRYEASGKVPGNIYGQFAIDEAAGVFRVASTDSSTAWANGLSVLKVNGTSLETVGTTKGLAPGEAVSAARFVGNTAYLVTRVEFHDPLFVVDTSDATAPKLLGQVPIEGFSTYVHPLDDQHLLTIGRDGINGRATGNLALRIYDVSDPAAPREAQKLPFELSGSSDAENNHKAFTYYPAQKLLAVPFAGYNYTPTGYMPTNSVELFSVDIDKGFKRLGAIDANVLLSPSELGKSGYSCNWYGNAAVDRGFFIENTLYAAGQRGLVAADISTPSTPISVVQFQSNVVPQGCWYSGDTVKGGTGGMPTTGGASFGGTSAGGTSAGGASFGGTSASGTSTGGAASGAGAASSAGSAGAASSAGSAGAASSAGSAGAAGGAGGTGGI